MTTAHRRIALLAGVSLPALAACNTPPTSPAFLSAEEQYQGLEVDRFHYWIDEAGDLPTELLG